MPKITVDDIEYNTEDLSDNGKAQLASLQFLEVQMKKLNSEIAVYQTARNAYVMALKLELDKTVEWAISLVSEKWPGGLLGTSSGAGGLLLMHFVV